MVSIAEAFDRFTREAWHLEDVYRVPEYDEQITAWRPGHPTPPRRNDWDEVLRDAAARSARRRTCR